MAVVYNPYLPQDPAASFEPPGVPSSLETGSSPKKGGLSLLLKSLKLESLDTGDVLLLLILLFLFLDDREDNLQLLITLGLMLIL